MLENSLSYILFFIVNDEIMDEIELRFKTN